MLASLNDVTPGSVALRGKHLYHWFNFIYLFISQENKWMKQFLEDEQKSRKELERVVRKISKQKNDCTWDDGGHWTDPLTSAVLFRVVPVNASAVLVAGQERSGAPIPLFCLCVASSYFTRPQQGRAPPPHLGSPLLNPSSWTSLSRPDQECGSAKGGPVGWDADQNKSKEKRPLAAVAVIPPPAHGAVSDNFSTSFIYSDVGGNSEAIKSNTVSCMHRCYQGDRFLSLAPFFFLQLWFHVLRGTLEEKL